MTLVMRELLPASLQPKTFQYGLRITLIGSAETEVQ
jgi:hypothetical protein